jgi:hypothetical protein
VLRLSADEYVERACGARPKTAAERVRLYDQLSEERAQLRAEMARRPRGPNDPLRSACFRAEVALFALGRADLAASIIDPGIGARGSCTLCYAAYDLLPVPSDLSVVALRAWIMEHGGELAWDPIRRRYGFAVRTEDWVLTSETPCDVAGAVDAVLGGARFEAGEAIYVAKNRDVRIDGTRRALAPTIAALEAHTRTTWRAARKQKTYVDHASRTYISTSMTRPSLIAARG